MVRCTCEKTYVLQDGGHRIIAAFKIYQDTGKDLDIPVNLFKSSIP
ncbi:hypothetical protein [Grimontia kaedaensis]|nr:hypothetical protein [Grimontia kaedaensis]